MYQVSQDVRLQLLDNIALKARLIGHERQLSLDWAGIAAVFFGLVGMAIGFVAGVIFGNGALMPIGAVLAACLGYYFNRNRCPEDELYKLLIDYPPLNAVAYSDLQLKAEDSKLTPAAVLEWVQLERLLATPNKDTVADLSRKRFASLRNK